MTALYAGLNALILTALALAVVRQRYRAGVGLGDGGEPGLRKAVRAHGNAAENIPQILLLLLLLESLAAPPLLLHGLGICLTLGRLLHPLGLARSESRSLPRALGMGLTWIALLGGGLACLFYAFRALA